MLGSYLDLNEDHRLAGWNLKIVRRYELVMFRGKSSFSVSGTDFPLNYT